MRATAITRQAAAHVREGAFWLRIEKYYVCNPERTTRHQKRASHRALRRDAAAHVAEGLREVGP